METVHWNMTFVNYCSVWILIYDEFCTIWKLLRWSSCISFQQSVNVNLCIICNSSQFMWLTFCYVNNLPIGQKELSLLYWTNQRRCKKNGLLEWTFEMQHFQKSLFWLAKQMNVQNMNQSDVWRPIPKGLKWTWRQRESLKCLPAILF